MDRFDKFLKCMDDKIAELDTELQSLSKHVEILKAIRLRAEAFTTTEESDDDCPNWP